MAAPFEPKRWPPMLWGLVVLLFWVPPVAGQEDAGRGGEPSALTPAERIEAAMPPAFTGSQFLTLDLWQWAGLGVLLVAAILVGILVRFAVRPVVRNIVRRTLADPPFDAVRAASRPIAVAAAAVFGYSTVGLLGLRPDAEFVVLAIWQVVLVGAVAFAAWAISDLVGVGFLRRADSTAGDFDDMIVPLLRRAAKLVIVGLGVLYVAEAVNVPIGPLLASFGLVGLAVSFAAQDVVKHLFGGMTIFLDRPFAPGHFITYSGYTGTVEEIGFRSIRLRTLDGNLVTIPNGTLLTAPVENITRRPTIRRILNFELPLDMPHEKLQQTIQLVRDILDEKDLKKSIHPVVDGSELAPRVYLNDLKEDGWNLFVIYWFGPPDWWAYQEHSERFHLRLAEEFAKANIRIALPTQQIELGEAPDRKWLLGDLVADRPQSDEGQS